MVFSIQSVLLLIEQTMNHCYTKETVLDLNYYLLYISYIFFKSTPQTDKILKS